MMEDMYATMSRINQIRERFNLNGSEKQDETTADAAMPKAQSQSFASLVDTASSVTEKGMSSAARGRGAMSIDEINLLAEKEAKKAGVSASLVKAVIQNESAYDPDAISSKGAMGLMQLMPKTAESLGVTDPFSPEENIRGGVSLLKNLLSAYKGDYQKAVAAYNAGKGAVDKYNGSVPYAETQNYVKNVINTISSQNEDSEE